MPFCIDKIKVYDENNVLLAQISGNYKTIVKFDLDKPIITKEIVLKLENESNNIPVSLFYIHIE
jgi:hypothetical protein